MLILLPPSEGKASTGRGRPVDLDSLSLPELTPARTKVLDALTDLCADADRTEEAVAVLGLSAGQRGEVERDARLRDAPTLPAARLYTGVLYDALDLASLGPAQRRRAQRFLLICSGLWGAVRLRDRIPAYRCSMTVRLPGVGALGAFWRESMPAAFAGAAGRGLVLDLRSSAYATAWTPTGDIAGRTATVRVLQETRPGDASSRTVVSHFNKATKGRLVRDLLTSDDTPRRPAELVEVLRGLGYQVEAERPDRGRPWPLDVVVTSV
ncbi:peroxide stress protein YaaA [Actinopolymorpha sp. NPDC004070]|uniref:peroxide stress protein YaaA n=1 Tax=Actinopolymorpha sp. NPDC004070 TaxID=3154548 RepID=UPI0033B370A5